MTPPYRYADVRGARIAWNATGHGPTVIWCHGMSASAYLQESVGQFDWKPLSASDFRLVRYDARGHGRSGGGQTPEEYTWPELAKDLLTLLDEVAPGEKVHAIGSSMGTATIIHAALARPDRFDRLVLTTPPTFWQTRKDQIPLRLNGADFLEQHGLRAFEKLSVNVPASPALVDARAYVTPVASKAAIFPSVLRGSAVSDLPDATTLATLSNPTLILSWTGDGVHPVVSGETLNGLLPNSSLHVADTPAQLHTWPALVLDFLRSASR